MDASRAAPAAALASAQAPLLLLTALARAEAAAAELTTRGASALGALRPAVAAAASAKASKRNSANANGNAANAPSAASSPPLLTEEEVQAVWDAALKLWVGGFHLNWSPARAREREGERVFLLRRSFVRRRCSFFFYLIQLSLPLSVTQKQNTCVDACNGLQPPAWHVDARQLAW